MFTWTQIVTALGGEALFLAAAGWLVKSLVSHRLTKEAEEFRIQLQSDANVQIEKLRAALHETATGHQIRFAKLHEERAKVIKDLYQRLIQARADAAQYVLGDARKRELAIETTQKVMELFRFITENRIFLPSKVCELAGN
jgi:hypothetical protein